MAEVSKDYKSVSTKCKLLSEEAVKLEKYKQIDVELVGRVRLLLGAEWDKQVASGDNKYSVSHYEEIMDKRSPLTCWRYLVQRDYLVDEALELMKAALVWQKANGADESRNADLIKEFWFFAVMAFTGKGYDGRDVMYVVGRNYRRCDAILRPIIKLYCMNLLFGWDRLHRHDLSQFVMVFDVSKTGYRNIDLEFMSWLVSMREFIPARIAQVHVVGLPIIVRPFVSLIISWLPEHFQRLVSCGSFEELVEANIASDQRPPEAGGTAYQAYTAPLDAPWLKDTEIYQEPAMLKAIKDSLWFHADEDRRKLALQLQLQLEEQKNKHQA